MCLCVGGGGEQEKNFLRGDGIKSIAGGSADDRIDEEKDNEKMNRITGKQRTDLLLPFCVKTCYSTLTDLSLSRV